MDYYCFSTSDVTTIWHFVNYIILIIIIMIIIISYYIIIMHWQSNTSHVKNERNCSCQLVKAQQTKENMNRHTNKDKEIYLKFYGAIQMSQYTEVYRKTVKELLMMSILPANTKVLSQNEFISLQYCLNIIRLSSAKNVSEVWRACLQCSRSKGVDWPINACMYCWEHLTVLSGDRTFYWFSEIRNTSNAKYVLWIKH